MVKGSIHLHVLRICKTKSHGRKNRILISSKMDFKHVNFTNEIVLAQIHSTPTRLFLLLKTCNENGFQE